MATAATLTAILAAVKALVNAVSGTSGVDVKVGGPAPWTKAAKPGQSWWVVHVAREPGSDYSFGGAAGPAEAPGPVVQIEGWMPWQDNNPATANAWDDLLDAVANTLRDNRSLSLTVEDASLPQLLVNDLQAKGDGESDPRLCHHAVFEVTVEDYEHFTAA